MQGKRSLKTEDVIPLVGLKLTEKDDDFEIIEGDFVLVECNDCKWQRRQQNDVSQRMFKPGLRINTKNVLRTYRQDRIDDFIICLDCTKLNLDLSIINYGYNSRVVDEISQISKSNCRSNNKDRAWKWLIKCPSPVFFGKLSASNLFRRRAKIYPVMSDKITEADGGFFQSFGDLMQEHSEQLKSEDLSNFKNIGITSRSAFYAIERGEIPSLTETEENLEDKNGTEPIPDAPPISENDTEAEVSTDDEGEREAKDYIAIGWNIDELYLEVLFEIIHNVGCDVNADIGQLALLSYIQDAFKMNNEKHSELMSDAEKKEPPKLLLNVEIIEAKELVAKDSNGLSDPFVTLYLMSDTTHKYNTSVKEATLSPLWEEHFALPMPENISEDTLCVEVWDFDPAESVSEKISKVSQVKGVKGLRKLIKEIAITATTGQHQNELIGRALIPLKAIPASGLTMWYNLDKKNRTQRRGVLKMRLAFGSKKNSQVAAQEHKYLLKILLLHELELSKVTEYWWCGTFTPQAEAILTQHSIQSGLTKTELLFVQWSVYCNVHLEHPLNYTLFSNLLDKLLRPIQTAPEITDDIKLFWEATKKLLPSCFTIIRKIRKKTAGDKNMMKQLVEILKLFNKLMTLIPENIDMFPENNYSWLCDQEEKKSWDLNWVITQAINQGANHWFTHFIENNKPEDNTDEAKLQYLIKIITFVRTDLLKAIEYYDQLFQENVKVPYAKTLYVLYEAKLAVIIQPEVEEVCKSLEKLFFPGNIYPGKTQNYVNPEEPLATGTTLFELYLLLKRFVLLGTGLCPADYESFAINNFYIWFQVGVAQWLNIAVYKTLQVIKKAIEIDNLVPVDDSVGYSSSAIDTLTIFYQVKTFWTQLDWPEVEGSYSFIAKIIDDICRCCVYFADEMSKRVEGMCEEIQDPYEKKFEVTSEWCLAINNIEYIQKNLRPFTEQLNLEDILQKLSDLKGDVNGNICKLTLNNVIENAIDTVTNKIIELLETVASKMSPVMKKLLIEGAEIFHQDSNSIDRVMRYLDNNLAILYKYLNEENFKRMLDIFWEKISQSLYEIYQTNLDKRRPPSFFANLHETLKMMVSCFKKNQQDEVDGNNVECEDLKRIENLLAINGMETSELIHEVQLDRWREQQNITNSPFGQLTVRIKFEGNQLFIEVMNARNLKAMDSNGSTDSFIRIHFLPEEKFTNISKPKTKIHYKSLFPLYDETFTINLTPEQRKSTNALVLFSVKDKDFFMSNQYIAEAYVHFLEIPETTNPLSEVPQVHLELHRPSITDNDAIKALEYRQGDKLAKEFVKKFKQKIGTPPPQNK